MKGIRIRPEHDGLRSALFDLEAEIMECVWCNGWQTFSVADVVRELQAEREIAYTTVMTTVSRLFDKGLLHRFKDGRRYIYQAKMTREAFIERMTREVLSSLPPSGRQAAMALLVEQIDEANEAELDRLEALIQARREQRQAGPPDGER